MTARLYCGDALTILRGLSAGSARMCCTSPPYWGLRDYGVAGQLGLERTPEGYVTKLVEVFREVRRVLTDDATLWLVLGDAYAGSGRGDWTTEATRGKRNGKRWGCGDSVVPGLAAKQLVGVPWRVAFALQADGWYLRSDVIWSKSNPMPESVRDRPTKAHEYVFLLSKATRYFYDATAIAEPSENAGRLIRYDGNQKNRGAGDGVNDARTKIARNIVVTPTRNARTVWTIPTQPYPDAHFATFPEELARRCILAGSALGDTVLDPFSGSGTTAAVAVGHGRSAIGIELNPAYQELARDRIGPMLCEVTHA